MSIDEYALLITLLVLNTLWTLFAMLDTMKIREVVIEQREARRKEALSRISGIISKGQLATMVELDDILKACQGVDL